MKVFYDTETTGKWNYRKSMDDPCQPRAVSFGLVAFSEDGNTEVGSFYAIIRPEGFVIDNNSEACQINGITQEMALACGISLGAALNIVNHYFYAATHIGCFNSEYDYRIYSNESRIAGKENYMALVKQRCLKIAYTSLVQKPPNPGFSDYAWPKLEEAYEWMYGVKPEGAHNASQDARYTAWLAFEAAKLGLWSFTPVQTGDR